MKTIKDNPWEQLEKPVSGSLSMRRVNAEFVHDFYFAKDGYGQYSFVFALHGPAKIQDKLSLNGVDVTKLVVGGTTSIFLVLKNNNDWPIFLKICLDLCEVTSRVTDETLAVKTFCNRLLYWQYFMKRNKDNRLTKEEQIGLIGELLFIEKYLMPKYDMLDVINFWTGADADVQDFFVDGKRVEIKTCMSPSKNEVHISSLQQLFDSDCDVYLGVFFLGMANSELEGAFSLSSLANKLSDTLRQDPNAHELFIEKLASVGMFLEDDYNDAFYITNGFKSYKVEKDFPRITPEDIRAGVTKANYIINLANCSGYETPIDKILKG